MKIAVISDTHLGYAFGTDRQEDCFEALEEAFDKAIKEKPDLILMPGDIFDSRTPRQEVWAKALKLFQKPLLAEKSNAKLVEVSNGRKPSEMALKGIPVIAIHGTHEKRSLGLVNPVELLDQAGFLIHLHKSYVLFEKQGEKVAVHGFSGVPEREVKKELEEWSPKPIQDAFNIFMFHQSLKEEIYDVEDSFISIEDLPKGFDLYIDGHIHWSKYYEDKRLLIAGSTIITQQKEREAKIKKGFFIIETNPFKLDFIELENQRPFYFKEFSFEKADPVQVREKIREYLEVIPKGEKKPLVKIKLVGRMQEGRTPSQIDLSDFRSRKDMIVSIDNELEAQELKKLVEELRELHKSKKSIDEIGEELLLKILSQTNYEGIKPSQLIGPLSEGNQELVLKMIEEKVKQAIS